MTTSSSVPSLGDPGRSRVVDLLPQDNRKTVCFPLSEPSVPVPTVGQALQAAQQLLGSLEEAGPGYLVLASNGRESAHLFLSSERLDRAVIGRHTACDLVLAGDGRIALRHFLARASHASGGEMKLELLNLGAELPIRMPGGESARNLCAGGPVVGVLGNHVLVGLPVGPAEELWTYRDAPRLRAPLSRSTEIRHLRAVSIAPEARAAPPDAAGRLGVKAPGARTDVWVTRAELADGVLIGRYADRCLDKGISALLHEGISRTHLLLIGTPENPVAYDLASTNGVYCQKKCIRSLRLERTSPELELSVDGRVKVRWDPIP